MVKLLHLAYFLLLCFQSWGQICSQDSISSKRLKRLLVLEATGFVGSVGFLSATWYNEKSTSFHFHNDNTAWQGLDKLGHSYSNFQLCQFQYHALQTRGIASNKARWYAALTSTIVTSSIEILDGTQADYGFSWGDMTANSLGVALFLLNRQQAISFKWSFHPTPLAAQNPALLGKNLSQQWLKDYNGQTYWLSFNLRKLLPKSNLPSFFGIALGYGGYDMLHGQYAQNLQAGYEPYPIYYLSLDIHLSKIHTHSRLLQRVFQVFDMIKIPAPTLAFTPHRGVSGYLIFF